MQLNKRKGKLPRACMNTKITNMDEEHLTTEQIERFALPPTAPDAERERANAHIASCKLCRDKFQQALPPFAFGFLTEEADAADAHLDAELVVRYAEGEADAVEREIVALHMEVCRECRFEVKALQSVHREMEEEAGEKAGEEAGAITEAQSESVNTNKGPLAAWRARIRFWPEAPRLQWGLSYGGMALAGAGMLLLALQLPYFRQRPAPPQRNADAQSEQTVRNLQDKLTAARNELTQEKAARAAAEKIAKASKENPSDRNSAAPEEDRFIKSGRVAPPQKMASLVRNKERTMGGSHEEYIALLRPNGVFVSSLRPTFAWKAAPKAGWYRVTVIPHYPKRDEKALLYFAPAAARHAQENVVWKIPPGQEPLRPATEYAWTVEALDAQKKLLEPNVNSSPNEEVYFRTLTAAEVREVEQKQKRYANAPLYRAILYTRLGVLDEARQAFDECLKAQSNSKMGRASHNQPKGEKR